MGILGLSLLLAGVVAAVGFHRVPSSGICFASPMERTSLWPYNQHSGSLVLRYYFRDGPATSYRGEYLNATEAAFQAWSRAWPVLHFYRVMKAANANIIVRSSSFGEKGFWYDHAGLTLPDVDVLGCGLSHAVIEINNSYLVHAGALLYPMGMLRHLLLHEIGHALGLKHVYKPVASVMVPTSEAYRYDKPQPYDVRTLSILYPKPLRGTGNLTVQAGSRHAPKLLSGSRRKASGLP